MSSLVLLLALHAGPVPAIRPIAVQAGAGHLLVTLPTPPGMHWPAGEIPDLALGTRRAMEQAARPRLEGDGVSLEWLARDPGGLATIEFVGRVKGPLPAFLTLGYHAAGPVASVPATATVRLDGIEISAGRPAALQSLTRRAALDRLAADEVLSGGHGWFAFARKALAARHKIPEPPSLFRGDTPAAAGLFELASGAVSLDEALALGRIKTAGHAPSARTIPIDKVRAVTVTPHPWKGMLKGHEPVPEPLADAVPHDNWFLTAAKLETLASVAAMTQAWGGSPLRMAQMNERDHRLMERYQRQLCLDLPALVKAVPAKEVRGVALTGTDLFFTDGTDITVIVDTPRPKAFQAHTDKALDAARKLPGFTATTRYHRYTPVEGYTTPDRAVSLYRAVAGQRAIFSNSLPALTRVLDTIAGKRRSLSASLDFQYMRKVFPPGPKHEDGFVFLSDDFFASLLSPAVRIKAMRRLSTRAALTAISHAALLQHSLTGEWPVGAHTIEAANCIPGMSAWDSEGDRIRWGPKRGEATSPTMGTLSNGVPLVEIRLDDVTREEADAYDGFRTEYEWLWRRFIDPAGIRFHGDADRMRVEAHMLPLTNNQAYENLRWMTEGKHTTSDPARLAPAAAGAMRMSFRNGGWLAFHLDDSAALPAWAAQQAARLVYPDKAPPAAGMPPMMLIWGGEKGPRDARQLADLLDRLLDGGPLFLRDKQTSRAHRGVTITRVPVSPKGYAALIKLLDMVPAGDGLSPLALLPLMFPREKPPAAFYTAQIADGWYTALDEKPLVGRIDAWKKGAGDDKGEPAAAGVLLSTRRPGMAATAEMFLESQARHKALAANVMWQALYDAGAVTPEMSDDERARVALRLWGFVPAAPDGTAAVWDARSRQVRNTRHGTWSSPAAHVAPDARSPLARFVRGFDTLGIDLRFREDGIHAVMTFGHVR